MISRVRFNWSTEAAVFTRNYRWASCKLLTAFGRLLPPSTTVGTATSEGVRRVRRCSIRAIEGSSSTKWVWRVCGCPTRAVEGTSSPKGIRRVSGGASRSVVSTSTTKWVGRVCGRSTWAGIRPSSSEWIRRIGCGATGALEGPATTKRIRGVRGLCKYCAGYAEHQGREGFHGGLFQRIGHANVVKSCGLIGRA